MDEFDILFYIFLAAVAFFLLRRLLRSSAPERTAQAAGQLAARSQQKASAIAEAFKQGRNEP